MSSFIDIHVPHETVNDDFVTIVEWHAEPGTKVTAGQAIVSIETSKMVMDVEADGNGFLEIIQPVSAEVAVGELIGRIRPNPVAAKQADPSPTPNLPPTGTNEVEGVRISKKAKTLIEEHQIDVHEFAGRGLVKESDVYALLERREQSQDQSFSDAEAQDAPFSATEVASKRPGGLFAEARSAANDRSQSVFALAWNYLFRNWLLGNAVRWAPRGVILLLHKWRGVKMGEGCFIDPTAIVETAYPENITMGDDVRITAGVVIMTHIKAPHYLRDTGLVPPVLKAVILEDHCFIGVNAVVMPGVTVGKAAVVASGSVVLNNVPAYSMVSGNPAKVIKSFPQP